MEQVRVIECRRKIIHPVYAPFEAVQLIQQFPGMIQHKIHKICHICLVAGARSSSNPVNGIKFRYST